MGISNKKHGVRESGDVSGSNITDDEMDLLPMFCQHEERTLLSCGWVNGITHVSQRFIGGAKDFRTALCKYAIEIEFEFVYMKNEKCRVTAVCSIRESKACLWRVHAFLESANNFFYIRTLHDEHTCGAAVRLESVNNFFYIRTLHDEHTCGAAAHQYGLTIMYNHAWLGVEKARTTTFGDFSMSFDEIRWYMDIVMSTNPGFRHCRPLLFIDGAFLKGKYKGTLLTATAKDGDQGFFHPVMAIVDMETIDSWEWFFMHLSNILLDERQITFISDRNAGLLKALPKVLPTAYHYFCLQHLNANLRDRFYSPSFSNTFRSRIVFLFSSCAYAPIMECFNQFLKELQDEGKWIVCRFLSHLPYDKWTNAYFKGQKYGEMHLNVAESFNSWIRQARHLPTTKMIDSIRLKIMDLMSRRRE
ncbi:uncharacterized protein LOC114274935 [Camellia sinensis]|uniref:uncharacterized protein LOC114274935 n=1 Tax=Camellia sinensis TaxID=4442 RepID=UPI001036CB55|nr:uncharacterized protein LOC114274935 [Camellia sinensis]